MGKHNFPATSFLCSDLVIELCRWASGVQSSCLLVQQYRSDVCSELPELTHYTSSQRPRKVWVFLGGASLEKLPLTYSVRSNLRICIKINNMLYCKIILCKQGKLRDWRSEIYINHISSLPVQNRSVCILMFLIK